MTNREKTRELARKHQGTMTDAQYLSMFNAIEEMAEWKDKQAKQNVNDVWLCSIMCQDHTLSNKNHQYIDLDMLKDILEDLFHIKLDEEEL